MTCDDWISTCDDCYLGCDYWYLSVGLSSSIYTSKENQRKTQRQNRLQNHKQQIRFIQRRARPERSRMQTPPTAIAPQALQTSSPSSHATPGVRPVLWPQRVRTYSVSAHSKLSSPRLGPQGSLGGPRGTTARETGRSARRAAMWRSRQSRTPTRHRLQRIWCRGGEQSNGRVYLW